jgi:hypothetical protein
MYGELVIDNTAARHDPPAWLLIEGQSSPLLNLRLELHFRYQVSVKVCWRTVNLGRHFGLDFPTYI